MVTLHVQHAVPDFDAWKQAFDRDPVDRRGSGVRRYRVGRWDDGTTHVVIDLDFDDVAGAEAMHAKLRALWDGPARDLMVAPSATLIHVVDDVTL